VTWVGAQAASDCASAPPEGARFWGLRRCADCPGVSAQAMGWTGAARGRRVACPSEEGASGSASTSHGGSPHCVKWRGASGPGASARAMRRTGAARVPCVTCPGEEDASGGASASHSGSPYCIQWWCASRPGASTQATGRTGAMALPGWFGGGLSLVTRWTSGDTSTAGGCRWMLFLSTRHPAMAEPDGRRGLERNVRWTAQRSSARRSSSPWLIDASRMGRWRSSPRMAGVVPGRYSGDVAWRGVMRESRGP
jgi:hypothetical protein